MDRTDGVPLFIEELTKTIVESGIVTEAGDHYAVAGPIAPLAIPISLHASLLSRLDSLAPAREVAQICAALGRSFSYELVSAVSLMPQQQLDSALAQLVSAELIFRRGIPPEADYTFKHALVQDAAYSTLLKSRRQQIHARIVATLEEKFPDVVAAQPALLAQHCSEASLTEKGVEYWLKAGRHSVERSAMMEAMVQLDKGLELLKAMPDATAMRQQEIRFQQPGQWPCASLKVTAAMSCLRPSCALVICAKCTAIHDKCFKSFLDFGRRRSDVLIGWVASAWRRSACHRA